MPIFERQGMRLLFIHIPKCGGSSIETAFKQMGFTMQWFAGKGPFQWGCPPQHYHAELIQRRLAADGIDRLDGVFAVVRNPIDRMVSEYNFRMQNLLRLAERQGKAAPRLPGLDGFIATAAAKWRADPLALDNHMRPQHEFLLPGCRVFRFESGLQDIIAAVMRMHRIVPVTGNAMPHAQRSKPQADRTQLSLRTLATINEIYAEDFTRFGYGHPWS
jgi:hypothetical protein